MALDKLYQERIIKFGPQLKEKESITNRISTFRILLFLLLFSSFILYISSDFQDTLWLLIFLGCIPVFAYLIKWHQREFDEKERLKQLLTINEKELKIQLEKR